MNTVIYTDNEKNIIAEGISAVKAILLGHDREAKERLLLCLDFYMDPYYGHKLPYEKELTDVLQLLILAPNPLSIKEDALRLLTDYAYPPFSILEEHLTDIEYELREDASYAVNMGKEDLILTALLEQCRHIFRSLNQEVGKLDPERFGLMPQAAVVMYCENRDCEPEHPMGDRAIYTWRLEQDNFTHINDPVRYAHGPVSGMFYSEGAFWISFDMGTRTAYLIYEMGPRFGRCLTYDLVFQEKDGVHLTNETVIWVS